MPAQYDPGSFSPRPEAQNSPGGDKKSNKEIEERGRALLARKISEVSQGGVWNSQEERPR